MGSKVSKEDIRKHYKLKEVLGKGNFATVRKARRKSDKKEYAVKIIKRDNLDEDDEAIIKSEIEILNSVNHPNCVKLIEIFVNKTKIYLVLQLLSGGELFDRIVNKGSFSEKEAAQVIYDVASALKYCHRIGVVHRDLKPENLIYANNDEDAPIIITDFGLAKRVKKTNSIMQTQCGTPDYVAPEILHGYDYNKSVDMWSLGIILYVLLCGYPPFFSEDRDELFEMIKDGEYEFPDPDWTNISNEAKDLVRNLLTTNAGMRLTATGVLKHPWIMNKDNNDKISFGEHYNKNMKRTVALQKLRHGIRMVMAINKFKSYLLYKSEKIDEENIVQHSTKQIQIEVEEEHSISNKELEEEHSIGNKEPSVLKEIALVNPKAEKRKSRLCSWIQFCSSN